MAHPLINSDTADRLFSALCNTLLHSLWQGILLAAIAGIIIISTRKATSALRYNLLVSALLAFTIGVGITFAWQYQRSEVVNVAMPSVQNFNGYTANMNVQPVHIIPINQPQTSLNLTQQLSSYLNDHHNTIVLIWFLIVCARSLQLGFGLYATRRLKRVGVSKIEGAWLHRMQQLADQLGIRQSVTLLESALAKVPMVIGHLKPVVLVPIGLLTALSAEEVEAILVHELAHIKRRDYLVNMLQSLVEIVLFFNPAVLWVSKLIKTERENCCDDLAIAQNNNKISYIRALVSCEEYRASVPAYAMGLPGSKNSLLHRVQRMVNNSNNSLNLFEKTVLAVCLVALGLGVSAFTAREHIAKALKSVAAAIHHHNKIDPKAKAITAKHDTTKKKQSAPVNDVDNLVSKLQQGPILADTIKNGDRQALNLLKHVIDSLQATPDKFKSPQLFAQGSSADNFKSPQFFSQPGADNFKFNGKPDTNFFKWKKGGFKPFHDMGQELYREHVVTDTNHMSISLNEKELIVNGVRMSNEMHDRIYKKFGSKAGNGTYSSDYKGSGPGSHGYHTSSDWDSPGKSQQIGNELLSDNLVKDKNHFTYKLNKDGLYIDDVKQPDELYRRIVDEHFKPDDNFNIGYTYKNSGTVDSNRYRKPEADYRSLREEQKRSQTDPEKALVADLMKDGIITSTDDLSFKIGTTEFVVNYKKQPEAVYQRYRVKYVPNRQKGDWIWFYQFDTSKWDQMTGHKSNGGPDGTATGVFQDKEDTNSGGYNSGDYQRQGEEQKRHWADSVRYGRSSHNYQFDNERRQRVWAEQQKSIIADLMKDGLITDPKNMSFSMSDNKFVVNGKKQSDEVYKKYKDKYRHDNNGSGWNWDYSHNE